MRPTAAPASFPATRLPQLTQLVTLFSSPHASLRSGATTKGPQSPQWRHYPTNIDPPGKITPVLLGRSSSCILVNDAFPKATVHMLVLPVDTKLQSLNDLNASHVKVLLDMKATAQNYVAWAGADTSASNGSEGTPTAGRSMPSMSFRAPFAMGFHAIPSLPMLHMHVMTLDIHTAPRLKKRAHYNSFATKFFLPVDDVVRDLQSNGFVTINQDVATLHKYETQSPYACLWCGSTAYSQLPALKEHIASCPLRRCGSK